MGGGAFHIRPDKKTYWSLFVCCFRHHDLLYTHVYPHANIYYLFVLLSDNDLLDEENIAELTPDALVRMGVG